MKLAVLTTDTTHHTYFVRELAAAYPVGRVIVETSVRRPVFETAAPFETERDEYERAVLLGGRPERLDDCAETRRVASVNENGGVAALKEFSPDVSIVFGTGRLHAAAIRAAGAVCLNLHGGNPEEYRGVDTHLWAIYHDDFENLMTTLHHVDLELDTGNIVGQTSLPLARTTALHQLRGINTRACVDLVKEAVGALQRTGTVASRPQRRRGRYYSFMPAVLKVECLAKFTRHVGRL